MTLRRVLRETNTFLSCTSVTGVGRGKCISGNETPLQGTGGGDWLHHTHLPSLASFLL